MRYSKIKILLNGTILILTISSLMGCAGKPESVELPINHPANPKAFETEFIAPQNPFQIDVAGMQGEPESNSMMKHEMNEEKDQQHKGHNMGMDKKSQSDSESTMKPDHRQGDNQHKGHSQ